MDGRFVNVVLWRHRAAGLCTTAHRFTLHVAFRFYSVETAVNSESDVHVSVPADTLCSRLAAHE